MPDRPTAPLPRRLRPMEPDDGAAPFDDAGYRFEPWWPGTRVLLFHEGGEVRLQVEQLADPLTAFPELRGVGELLGEGGVIVDGTLLVLDAEGRPDADLLRERLAYPEVRNGEAAFVASDLVWAGGRDVSRRPFADRLERLQSLLRETDWCMVARGYVGEGLALADALAAMGLDAMSARHLDSPYRRGPSAGAWLRVPVVPAPVLDRRPTLALIQRLGL
jgi:bifunctional non-homologous end joining protein LigD